jgi:hypothetical protein
MMTLARAPLSLALLSISSREWYKRWRLSGQREWKGREAVFDQLDQRE